MPGIVESLIEMGFTKERAELAISKTGTHNIEIIMDWLVSHEDESGDVQNQVAETPTNDENHKTSENQNKTEDDSVRSLKCEDCGKLFETQAEVEFHATKSGHLNYASSTEEKKPMTEADKKEQLAKIEAKLKKRRMEREAREKQEALEKEKCRIKSGKELLEAKKKHDELEMKKIVEQRKREKEEERLAKQRVKEQIEQDKLARKAKFGGQPDVVPVQHQDIPISVAKPQTNYSEVMLQIRLPDGSALTQKFGAKEPLSAVRLYVEINRKDGDGPFNLMTTCPKKVFGPEEYDIPLETLGLAPRAILIVSKT